MCVAWQVIDLSNTEKDVINSGVENGMIKTRFWGDLLEITLDKRKCNYCL